MSGEYGVGFRIQGGNYYEGDAKNIFPGVAFPYPAAELYAQLSSLPIMPKWIIFGLSAGADGLEYTSPHPNLTTCKEYLIEAGGGDRNATLCQTPTGPKKTSVYDNFYHLASWFKNNTDIKVIVYMASEGPAKLHHCYHYGIEACNDAFDWDETANEAPAMEAWLTKVATWAPELTPGLVSVTATSLKQNAYSIRYDAYPIPPERDLLHKAYAEKVVKYFATEYKDLIDGYWFDHATNQACNRQYIRDAIRSVGGHQADVPIAFQHNTKVPLDNRHPGEEDYTGGHPNPLRGDQPTPPYSCQNEPMVESIETQATNGYFEASGEKSLGHIFLPTNKASWNRLLRLPGWDNQNRQDKAIEWMHRAKQAGGAWSWNPPMMSNNINDCDGDSVYEKPQVNINCTLDYKAWGKLDEVHVTFLQEIIGRLKDVLDGDEILPGTHSCDVPSASPTAAPTAASCTNAVDSCWGYDKGGTIDPPKYCGSNYFETNKLTKCCNFSGYNSCTSQMELAKVACCAQCAEVTCP